MGIDFCNGSERLQLRQLFGNNQRDLDIKPLYTYLCPVIIFICFFSIIFNAILISISRQSKVVNKSPILLLSLNLAVTDLVASLLNGSGILFNSYLPEVYDVKISQCSMLMFEVVRCAALVASALHLLALAFVHYRGIVNPLHYRSTIFFSQHLSRTINIISIACWLLPLTIMVAWFSSSPCQGFQTAECDYLFLLGFTYRYMVLTLFALPLLLMSVIYMRIFIIISRHQKGRRLNHERSALTRGVLGVAGPVGTAPAARVNLPQLIARAQEQRADGGQRADKQQQQQQQQRSQQAGANCSPPDKSCSSARCAACAARALTDDEAPTVELEPSCTPSGSLAPPPPGGRGRLGDQAARARAQEPPRGAGPRVLMARIRGKIISGAKREQEASLVESGEGARRDKRGCGAVCLRAAKDDEADEADADDDDDDDGDDDGEQDDDREEEPDVTYCDAWSPQNSSAACRASPQPPASGALRRLASDSPSSRQLGGSLNWSQSSFSQRSGCSSMVGVASLSYSELAAAAPETRRQLLRGFQAPNWCEATANGQRAQAEKLRALRLEEANARQASGQSSNDNCDSRLNETRKQVSGLALKLGPLVVAPPGGARERQPLISSKSSEPRASRQQAAWSADAPAARLRVVNLASSSLAAEGPNNGRVEELRAASRQRASSCRAGPPQSATLRLKAPLRAQVSLGAAHANVAGSEGGCLLTPAASVGLGQRLHRSQQLSLDFHDHQRRGQAELEAGGQRRAQWNRSAQSGAASSSDCTCDNKLTREAAQRRHHDNKSDSLAVSSGAGARRPLRRANTTSGSPSNSRLQQLQLSLRNKLASGNALQQDLISAQANSSFAITTLTSGEEPAARSPQRHYEPQRRHIHAAAVPQTNTKALVTTLLILGTYFISYVPAIIFQVLTCVDSCPYPLYTLSFSRRVLFGAITNLMLIAKSIIDPFIYSFRMSEIQMAVNRYLSKRRSKSSLGTSLQTSQRVTQLHQHNSNHNSNHNHSFQAQQQQQANSCVRQNKAQLSGSNALKPPASKGAQARNAAAQLEQSRDNTQGANEQLARHAKRAPRGDAAQSELETGSSTDGTRSELLLANGAMSEDKTNRSRLEPDSKLTNGRVGPRFDEPPLEGARSTTPKEPIGAAPKTATNSDCQTKINGAPNLVF